MIINSPGHLLVERQIADEDGGGRQEQRACEGGQVAAVGANGRLSCCFHFKGEIIVEDCS